MATNMAGNLTYQMVLSHDAISIIDTEMELLPIVTDVVWETGESQRLTTFQLSAAVCPVLHLFRTKGKQFDGQISGKNSP